MSQKRSEIKELKLNLKDKEKIIQDYEKQFKRQSKIVIGKSKIPSEPKETNNDKDKIANQEVNPGLKVHHGKFYT